MPASFTLHEADVSSATMLVVRMHKTFDVLCSLQFAVVPEGTSPTPGVAEPAQSWTVQCSYAGYFANTVTVEAESAEEACRRAIELANSSDG